MMLMLNCRALTLLVYCSIIVGLPALSRAEQPTTHLDTASSSSQARSALGESQAITHSKQLQSCINSNQPDNSITTWQKVLDERPTHLTVSHITWSQRSPSSQLPLTITTGLSLDRLYQLKAQCMGWPGPLSAVVYLAIIQDADHASLVPDTWDAAQSRRITTLEAAKQLVSAGLIRAWQLQVTSHIQTITCMLHPPESFCAACSFGQ